MKYELYNFLTKSIKDETSFIDMKDESVVMKSEEIIPLIYEKFVIDSIKIMKNKIKRFERKWILKIITICH